MVLEKSGSLGLSDSFKKLIEDYSNAPEGRASKDVLKKMCILASTIDEWTKVYDRAFSGSDLEKLALTKIGALASSREDWRKLYEHASVGSNLEKLATAKLSELA